MTAQGAAVGAGSFRVSRVSLCNNAMLPQNSPVPQIQLQQGLVASALGMLLPFLGHSAHLGFSLVDSEGLCGVSCHNILHLINGQLLQHAVIHSHL